MCCGLFVPNPAGLFLCFPSSSQGRAAEPRERHHRDPGQHGGGDHSGREDHQTCRWARALEEETKSL